MFLEKAIAFYQTLGVTIVQVQTDNGTEFTLPHHEITLASYTRGETLESEFTEVCKKYKIRHKLIKPRTPELNGKVERSHRIDNERFYSRYSFDSEFALDHALKTIWMPEYNERRPHSALGGKAPIDFLHERLVKIKTSRQIELLNNSNPHSEEKKAA